MDLTLYSGAAVSPAFSAAYSGPLMTSQIAFPPVAAVDANTWTPVN